MKTTGRISLTLTSFILTALFFTSLTPSKSLADIVFVEDNSATEISEAPFTEDTINSAFGEDGDFEVLACAVPDEGQLTMNPATPGWTTQDIGGCGGDPFCLLGVFTQISDSTGGDLNTCSWENGAVNSFSASLLRYRGVDPFVPVTAVACNAGSGTSAVAPSVETTANSVVVRLYASSGIPPELGDIPDFGAGRTFGIAGAEISTVMVGQPFAEEGDSGSLNLQFFEPTFWRACSVALQMDTGESPIRPIPTMSEWGLIATAGVLGLAGIIFYRRRLARA